jgi:hypothetical protein
VRGYLSAIREGRGEEDRQERVPFLTCGPKHRFKAILFIEKEGFMPLFRASHLAERYDLAIMSTKGLSVTASRMLVDILCAEYQIPLLVLHDFDKAGFSIVGTLQRDTRRYEFRNRIEVIDLGLRLGDVTECHLESEAWLCPENAEWNLRQNGATQEEVQFLCGGQRVELNAFSSGDLLAWIEGKLQANGVRKVVPDAATLALAFRQSLRQQLIDLAMEEVSQQASEQADQEAVPEDLADRVNDLLREHPAMPWDEAVEQIVSKIG